MRSLLEKFTGYNQKPTGLQAERTG